MAVEGAPTGTVTFLMTDVERSTALWEQYPAAMRSALAVHDAILRRSVEANQGTLVKTTGDGCHAAFQTAAQAIAAALDIQLALRSENWQALDGQALLARIGIHTGEAEARAGDYYGPVVNRVARLMAAGHGGQVLVSAAAAELSRDFLPPQARLADLGEHRLRDLVRTEHIFQLQHPALAAEFPALKTLDLFPNNLPLQTSSFIGREAELEEAAKLLASTRLLTLTGSGGTGKTRLSIQLAADNLEAFPGGAWLVELAPLADPAQVIPALAQIFGLQEQPFTSLENLVTGYLTSRQALLILDNCEHLISACARLADHLLHHCPKLKILASSREALGISGEASYHIPSLAQAEAIQLFEERARAVQSTFRVTLANAALVAQVCRRLDGIPLAIELAAARARLLTPEQIAARLNDRFRLLVGGSRTALPRQQTLRAMIDWSYDLLAEDEKRLLRVASVFAGGWTLEAIEALSDVPAALDHLAQLVNKSLVAAEEHGRVMRYFLLETIRQYAREKLFDTGIENARQVRTRHLAYYVNLTEESYIRLAGPDMAACLDDLELEQDNLRAAIDWAVETDPVAALRMGALLPTFWGRRLSATEGYTWISAALERAAALPEEQKSTLVYQRARALALLGKASMAFQQGDNQDAWENIVESIAFGRMADDPNTLAYALALGSTICGFQGDIATASAWAHESQDLSRRHHFTYTLANTSGMEMFFAALRDQSIPRNLIEETLQVARSSGNPWVLGLALTNIGRVNTHSGHWAEAAASLEESAGLFFQIRDLWMYNMTRSEIGHLLRMQGRYAEAAVIYRETIANFKDRTQFAAAAHEMECFGFMAAALGKPERAAALLGAAEALRQKIKTDMTPIERREYDREVAQLRARLEAAKFEQAWAAGRAMTMEEAIALAVSEP